MVSIGEITLPDDGYDAVIFDCDGTLVDSEKLDNRVLVDLLREIGLAVEFESFMRQYRGVNLYGAVEDLEKAHGIELGETFIANYRARLEEVLKSDLEAIPQDPSDPRDAHHSNSTTGFSPGFTVTSRTASRLPAASRRSAR